jgi:hypothetical protein
VIFVDYHGPKRSNPMRYVMKPILYTLEPFAMDLWRAELPAYMPPEINAEQITSRILTGGHIFIQKLSGSSNVSGLLT